MSDFDEYLLIKAILSLYLYTYNKIVSYIIIFITLLTLAL